MNRWVKTAWFTHEDKTPLTTTSNTSGRGFRLDVTAATKVAGGLLQQERHPLDTAAMCERFGCQFI